MSIHIEIDELTGLAELVVRASWLEEDASNDKKAMVKYFKEAVSDINKGDQNFIVNPSTREGRSESATVIRTGQKMTGRFLRNDEVIHLKFHGRDLLGHRLDLVVDHLRHLATRIQ